MGKSILSGLTTVVVAAGVGLVAGAGSAFAATAPLYVNNTFGAGCSDTGGGSQSKPFCTITAAVAALAPEQTAQITGVFNERVTVNKSTVVLRASAAGAARVSGPNAGFTIDGQHDVAILGINVLNVVSAPAFAVSNGARISVVDASVTMANEATGPAIKLAAVTDSVLNGVKVSGGAVSAGVAVDAATSRTVLKGLTVSVGSPAGSVGVDVAGSNNTILNSSVFGGAVAVVALRPGAAGNTVVNNTVMSGHGVGILNNGATGTAITNNSLDFNCLGGIRVAGASTGVSVQNNVATSNVSSTTGCDPGVPSGPEIGLYDGAAGTTVVDYNAVSRSAAPNSLYWWNGPLGLTGFRAASGQAAHDTDVVDQAHMEDSANSAAPGYQSTDAYGKPREDNPAQPDTGTGPVTYADRGNSEMIPGPYPIMTITADQAANSVTVDASRSALGYVPIATYRFDFGDFTDPVTQTSPVAAHHYSTPGTYGISVTAVDVNGFSGTRQQVKSLWPAARTFALLAHDNNRYVSATEGGNMQMRAYQPTIGVGEQFELVNVGGELVALRSRVNGEYFAVNVGPDVPAGSNVVWAWSESTSSNDTLFTITNNADGTISLRSVVNDKYLSSNHGVSMMTADRAAIGPWEEFSPVDVANAAVSLRAHANGRYVTAENGGANALIANRTAIGSWEQFDLVDVGGGWVALYSRANGLFVTAEAGGNQPLIANRASVGPWEKFKVIANADGSISLLAGVNNRYVTAENGGNSSLIANRTAIGPWEEFDR
ncbi:PKD domain-containing protein [Dactylosporangium sp. NPDC049140]|uniref:PKD domain-containing protein n=1 Tax=Dactylosporangium sp. NPDC049140 TaxID=3155647 RepID=UPI003405AE08